VELASAAGDGSAGTSGAEPSALALGAGGRRAAPFLHLTEQHHTDQTQEGAGHHHPDLWFSRVIFPLPKRPIPTHHADAACGLARNGPAR